MNDHAPQIRCYPRSSTSPVTRLRDDCLRRAGRLAAALHDRGYVSLGDRVAILAHNSIEFLESCVAVAAVGGSPLPINWHWTALEIAHVLGDAEVRTIVTDPALAETARQAASLAGRSVDLIHMRDDAAPDAVTIDELIDAYGDELGHVDGALAASLGVIYTSGTTGSPKGVLRESMTAEQILAVAAAAATRMGIRDGGSVLIPGPLYHTSPNAIAVLALRMGADLTLMDGFDAEQFLQLVSKHRVEHAKVVPTMLSRLLSLAPDVTARYDVSSLTHLVHSAAPCPPAIKRAAIDWFGSAVQEFYGCSEAGTITWVDAAEWLARPGTVGRPVDGAAVRILDAQGRELSSGDEGLVSIRGADYWPRFRYIGRGSSADDEDGFINVGDLGYVDADGYLFLTGRSSDIVIVGGTNIYPAEIEAAALSHPSVEDAAAVGRPSAGGDLGEEIVLYVVARPAIQIDPADLQRHLSSRLATIKLPRELIAVDHLPRDENGKLYRTALGAAP